MSAAFLRWSAFLLWLASMATLGLLYLTIPPSPDQSQFDWVAFSAIQGLPYYAASFDMNWPGAMLHEIGIRLFGAHSWTWRLTDFLLTTGFALAGAVFLARAGWRNAGLLFLALYPPLYVTAGGWMAGQRDIIASGFLLAACAAAIPGWRREGLATLLAGGLVAAAVLVRPTYLSFFVGLLALEALPLTLRRQRRQSRVSRAARITLGFAFIIGIAIVVGLAQGHLDDWYEQTVLFSLSLYVGAWPQDPLVTLDTLFVRSWHLITLLALIGSVLWFRRDGLSYPLALALGIAATCAVSFAARRKGFGYHLGGLLPVLVLMASVAFERLAELRQMARSGAARWALTLTVISTASLATAGTAMKLRSLAAGARLLVEGEIGPTEGYGLTEKERREITLLLASQNDTNAPVALCGTNYDLPHHARRLPSYRFFTPAADQINPEFTLYKDWLAEIDSALETRRPAFIVLERTWVQGPADSPRPAEKGRPILDQLVEHVGTGYTPVYEGSTVIVYQATDE